MPLFPNDYTLDSSRVHFVSRGVREMTALGVSPTNTSPLSMIMERQESSDNSPTPIARPSSKQVAHLRRATKEALGAPADRIPSLVPLPLPPTFSEAMHAAIEQQSRSQSVGVHAERYLRGAVALFEHALSLKTTSGSASLRLAAAQYQLSSHCRSHDAVAHLRNARSRLRMDDSVASKEALATVCGRLCELTRHPGDTLWGSESGGYASEALDALEDVAAGRMDRASTLTKSAFERETPMLATTFLALAEAASTVCTLSPDLETADAYAELADHALSHAANMASMSRARVLITHVQLTSARLAAEGLKFYSSRGEQGGWDDLVFELGVLATQTRDRARRLRGTRGAVAAEQAATAIKLLADARVMYASSLGIEHPSSPESALSSRSAPTTPAASVFSSFVSHGTPPGLEHSKSSWSSSDGSPPIPEEDEEREELEELQDPAEEDVTKVTFSSPPSMSTASAVKGKRAPPPPPLMLHIQELHTPPPLLAHRPGVLSPLNPARRASELPVRSPLAHPADVVSPRRATWMGLSTPVSPAARATPNSGSRRLPQSPPLSVAQLRWNCLAAATKGYKLALSLLSGANLPSGERASRKSDLLFAIAATALARAELAQAPVTPTKSIRSQDSSNTGSYFSPTAAHASPDSIRSLRLPPALAVPQIHVRQHGPGATTRLSPCLPIFNHHHLTTPPTPRDDPRSHTRATGAAALRATAEIYAAWAAREVGWSAVIDPKGAGADRRTGAASADEAGVRAVLLAVRVWWVRSQAGDDVDGASEDIDDGEWTSDAEDGLTPGERSDDNFLQSRVENSPENERDNRTPTGGPPPIGDALRAPATNATEATEVDPHVVAFDMPPLTARRVHETLRRLRREGTGPDDVRRFVGNLTKPLPPVEARFWHSVEGALE